MFFQCCVCCPHLSAWPKPLLLHGLFSSAAMNWMKFGHADLLAEAESTELVDRDVVVTTDGERNVARW